MVKRILSLLLSAVLLSVPVAATQYAPSNSGFSDVSQSAWYYDSVSYCAENNLMIGTGDGVFSPDSTLTWAEAVVLAARMYENTHHGVRIPQLLDAPWWQGGVNVLTDAEITLPDDLSATANRQGFVYLLHQVLSEDELKPLPYEDGARLPYLGKRYNSYTPQYVQDFYDAGILSGVPVGERIYGEFYPQKSLTRAEAAGILFLTSCPEQRNHPEYDLPLFAPTGISLKGVLANQCDFVKDSLFDLPGYAEQYVYLMVDGQPMLAHEYLTCDLTPTWENPYDGSMPWDKEENRDEILAQYEALYHTVMLQQFFRNQGVAQEDIASRITAAQIEEIALFQRFDLDIWSKAIQADRGWMP